MTIRKLLPLLLAVFIGSEALAQEELGLQLIPGLLQASKTNPALVPNERLVIGIPSVYGSYFHSPGSISTILDIDNKVATLNVQGLLDNVERDNYLRLNLELETINVFFRLSGKVAFNLHHSIKSSNYLSYPDALPKLFWQGNSQYIGEEVFFGADQHSFAYQEIGLGTALSFGKLTLGAKGKLLLGIGDVSTDRTNASLYTDNDVYQLTLNTDYRINTSTFDAVLLFDTLSGYTAEYGWDELFSFDELQSGNTGFAFDLGAKWEVTDQLSVAASVLDIGSINWRNNTATHHSQGSFTLEGLDLKDVLSDDSLSLEQAVDTVETIFEFEESSRDYSTTLPLKTYLNASYRLSDKLTLAALFYNESYRGENFTSIGIGGHYVFSKMLSAGATYSIRNNKYDNLGLNLGIRLGPVQLYAATDNVIAAVRPYDSNNVNLRVGLNWIFGQTITNNPDAILE